MNRKANYNVTEPVNKYAKHTQVSAEHKHNSLEACHILSYIYKPLMLTVISKPCHKQLGLVFFCTKLTIKILHICAETI